MKTLSVSILISAVIIAAAILYYAETGRYQITSVGTLPAAYKVDTRTGQVYVCSPLKEKACESIEDFRSNITTTALGIQESWNSTQSDFFSNAQNMMNSMLALMTIMSGEDPDQPKLPPEEKD